MVIAKKDDCVYGEVRKGKGCISGEKGISHEL